MASFDIHDFIVSEKGEFISGYDHIQTGKILCENVSPQLRNTSAATDPPKCRFWLFRNSFSARFLKVQMVQLFAPSKGSSSDFPHLSVSNPAITTRSVGMQIGQIIGYTDGSTAANKPNQKSKHTSGC